MRRGETGIVNQEGGLKEHKRVTHTNTNIQL
jgi:hypothetical protein